MHLLMMQDKAARRQEILAWRRALSPEEKAQMDAAIFRQLLDLPEFMGADLLFSYVSLTHEVDTRHILTYALSFGKTVVVPRCVSGTHSMQFYQITSLQQLKSGAYGVLEPPVALPIPQATPNSLMLVPALSVDLAGYRLGYGGGYYDRYLEQFPGRTICLCYARHRVEILPRDEFDRSCDAVLTEDGYFLSERSML